MLFVCYPRCTTCKKAQAWLDEKNIAYTYRHIKDENPTYDELKTWYEKSGLPLKKLFNTSGRLYKEMQLRDKIPAMTEDEQLRLLSGDGLLVKRPILVTDDKVLVGFRPDEWESALR